MRKGEYNLSMLKIGIETRRRESYFRPVTDWLDSIGIRYTIEQRFDETIITIDNHGKQSQVLKRMTCYVYYSPQQTLYSLVTLQQPLVKMPELFNGKTIITAEKFIEILGLYLTKGMINYE